MKLLQAKKSLLTLLSVIAYNIVICQTPQPPTVKFVSVNPKTDDITIAWYASQESNVDSLFVYHITKISPTVSGQPIFITKSNTNSQYTTNVSNIVSIGTQNIKSALRFSVDVKKGGKFSANLANYHQTIFATAKFQNCPTKCTITWTKYKGPNTSVSKYNIYKSDSTGDVLLGNVSGADSTYNHVFQIGSGIYQYYVEAVFTDSKGAEQHSTSNLASVTVNLPQFPKYITGAYSEVLSDDSIKLVFGVDLNADIKHFTLYKSDKQEGPYTALSNGDIKYASNNYLTLFDTITGVALSRHYYRLYSISDCGDTTLSSNIVSNIAVFAEKTSNSHNISWTDYKYFLTGVDRYELYRSIDKEEPFLLYTDSTQNAETFRFTDDLDVRAGIGNEQCYFVVAYPKKANNQTGITVKSTSNKACIKQEDRAFIPSAFNPASKIEVNKKFKPVLAFVNTDDYEFIVYNRFSDVLFKTTDPTAAWDGTCKGQMVAEGTYIYYVRYHSSDNKTIERRDTFFVIFNEQ